MSMVYENTQRDRQTDGRTDRQTYIMIDWVLCSCISDWYTHKKRHIGLGKEMDIQIGTHDRHTEHFKTDRQWDRQTDLKSDTIRTDGQKNEKRDELRYVSWGPDVVVSSVWPSQRHVPAPWKNKPPPSHPSSYQTTHRHTYTHADTQAHKTIIIIIIIIIIL